MSNKDIIFDCIELTQPIGTFYIGVMNAADLLQICYADVRRAGTKRDVEEYLGIERPLSVQRVAEIKEYVTTIDATFPTSIILAVPAKHVIYDEEKKVMTLERGHEVAKIIDGQHRIAGLDEYPDVNFQLNVTLFIDMDLEDQAMVFATINLKQTKVSKSLAYDLYDFAKLRSPQKTCHNIARFLNKRENSPFLDKIKMLGLASKGKRETLTQARFVENLMQLISVNPLRDRDLIKREKKLNRPTEDELRKLIFRNLFIEEKDGVIARILWNYFEAVKGRWPGAWSEVMPGNILNRGNGFSALMRFLQIVYNEVQPLDQIPSVADFRKVLGRIDLKENDFTRDNYPPGSSGETKLFGDLKQKSGLGSGETNKKMVKIPPEVRVSCDVILIKNEGTSHEQRKRIPGVVHIFGGNYWEFTEGDHVEVGDIVDVKSGSGDVVHKIGKVTRVGPPIREGWVKVTIVMENQ